MSSSCSSSVLSSLPGKAESVSDYESGGETENDEKESDNDNDNGTDSENDLEVQEDFESARELVTEIYQLDEQRKAFHNKASSHCLSSLPAAAVAIPDSSSVSLPAFSQSEQPKRLVRRLIIRSKPSRPLQITIGPRKGKKDIRPFLFAIFMKPKRRKRNEKGGRTATTDVSPAESPEPPCCLSSSSSSSSSASLSSSSSAATADNGAASDALSHSLKGKLGFVSRRVLIDTGARRSAITEEVSRLLHLQERGRRLIKVGTGDSQPRPAVSIAVAVYSSDHSISLVEMEVSVRTNSKHCLLGSDWIYAVAPKFVFGKQKAAKVLSTPQQHQQQQQQQQEPSASANSSENSNVSNAKNLGKEQIAALHSLLLNGKKIIRRPNGTKLKEPKTENAEKRKRKKTKATAAASRKTSTSPTLPVQAIPSHPNDSDQP
jgi:hypothetical protein